MRADGLLLALACGLSISCVPDLNVKASRVDQTRVVAVRATPAEATPGQMVNWQAVVVAPLQHQANTQIQWALCQAPRNPSDSITVTMTCLGDPDVPGPALGDGGVTPPTVTSLPGMTGSVAQAVIPSDACRKIGPEVSAMGAGGVKQRPPDADITGGYQLPLRLVAFDASGGDPRVDVSFDRQRVHCNLANAPAEAARDYAKRYKANQNPELQAIALAGVVGAADGSARYQVPRGTKIPVQLLWPDAARETYVLFDPVQRAVVERTETLDVSWYTNGGEFERDRTTQDGDAPSSSNTLVLDQGAVGPVTLWVVLRDERGGVGAGTLTIDPI